MPNQQVEVQLTQNKQTLRHVCNSKQEPFGALLDAAGTCSAKRMTFGYQASAWVNDVLATVGVVSTVNEFTSFTCSKVQCDQYTGS